ncbi:MAG TPA: ABC transporter substrate-binding protein [Bacillota bacterium]|nr:ABC transporter substrate-binding protein [Bacillota bacterium]
MRRLIVLGLIIGLLLAGSLQLGAENASVRVLALSGNTGLAMVRMMEQPVIDGVNYQFQVYKSPDQLIGKLVTGEADIAALPSNTAAILYNRGTGVQISSIIGWGVLYVTGQDRNIKQWTDLKGKEVFIGGKGAVPDLLFQYLCQKNGLKPDADIRISYIASPAELAQLVIAGKAPLAVIPEPWVTEVLERSPQTRVLLDFQKEWGRIEKTQPLYPQTCVVVRKQFAKEYPERVKAFSRELAQSIIWLERNPVKGGVLAEKYVSLSPVSVEKGLERCNLKYSDAYAVRKEVQMFLSRLYEVMPQAVGGKLPDEDFYYRP